MKLRHGPIFLLIFLFFRIQALAAPVSQFQILNVSTDKARYAPGEPVSIHIVLQWPDHAVTPSGTLRISFFHLAEPVGPALLKPICFSESTESAIDVLWQPPRRNFTGYFVDVRLTDVSGRELAKSETAVDVSSEWNRFPRYGYLADYNRTEGARPSDWISELNDFHIDGLQFYDFQDRHEQPLAGTVAHPDAHWLDIAGRDIERRVVDHFIVAAHQYNMMAMAYNSAYSSYADAFTDGSGVRLQWATWNTPDAQRTLNSAMSFNLPGNGHWQTPRLIFMDPGCTGWQNYLFSRMAQLFEVYPFDGWHIDTYGVHGAYTYDRSYVNFVSEFPLFVDRASEILHKRVVLNSVGTLGEEQIARSKADFVYSELWDQNETYDSILTAADRVHEANPDAGLVFAAYLHRPDGKSRTPLAATHFNMPSVLLTDATMFAAGASHIELGDGSRMLSSDYFPNDTTLQVSPALHVALRHYYDFLTAYENILRGQVRPLDLPVELPNQRSSSDGMPNTVWYIGRQKGNHVIVHLINLLGSSSDRWRDVQADRSDAPLLHRIRVRVHLPQNVLSAYWASPDVDGGRFQELRYSRGSTASGSYIELLLPSLKYWDAVILKIAPASRVAANVN